MLFVYGKERTHRRRYKPEKCPYAEDLSVNTCFSPVLAKSENEQIASDNAEGDHGEKAYPHKLTKSVLDQLGQDSLCACGRSSLKEYLAYGVANQAHWRLNKSETQRIVAYNSRRKIKG